MKHCSRPALLLSLCLLAACATQRQSIDTVGNNPASAAVMTGAAVMASGASRAGGGCYANCVAGTVCNKATGLCEVLPCRGQCSATQVCESTKLYERCVDRPQTPLQVEQPGPGGSAPSKAP